MGAVPVFPTIVNQEIPQQREPTENQAVSSNVEEQIDEEDSEMKSLIPQLLGIYLIIAYLHCLGIHLGYHWGMKILH